MKETVKKPVKRTKKKIIFPKKRKIRPKKKLNMLQRFTNYFSKNGNMAYVWFGILPSAFFALIFSHVYFSIHFGPGPGDKIHTEIVVKDQVEKQEMKKETEKEAVNRVY